MKKQTEKDCWHSWIRLNRGGIQARVNIGKRGTPLAGKRPKIHPLPRGPVPWQAVWDV